MAKKRINRKIKVITQTVYDDEYNKMRYYKMLIDVWINRGDKIPARVLKKYFSFFNPKEYEAINQKIKLYTENTIQYFSQSKYETYNYNFTHFKEMKFSDYDAIIFLDYFPQHRVKDEVKNEIVNCIFSLESLVEGVIRTLLMDDAYKTILNDYGKCLRFIYIEVSRYLDFIGKSSLYKKKVISAFIGSQLGKFETFDEWEGGDYNKFLEKKMATYSIPPAKKMALNPEPTNGKK